jgi:hypothetical protein
MAEHARMRVRLAFSMGTSMRGGSGLAGGAPIAVARMANSDLFRNAMLSAPRAQCGLIIDDYMYGQWIGQGFRADLDAGDFAPVRVRDPGKGFDEAAWLKIFGYSGGETAELVSGAGS